MTARRLRLVLPLAFALAINAWAQAEDLANTVSSLGGEGTKAAKLFGFGFSLGTDILPIPGTTTGETQAYQTFGFKPDLKLGQFGVGLDLAIRARITLSTENPIDLYLPDWVPNYQGNGKSILDIYLPKIQYVSYGQRGQGVFAKLGTIEDMIVGNGFIMGSYSNARFLPEQRIFGAMMGLDGSLFKFPYLGVEAVVGNLARFDVLGGRLYARPLAALKLPVLKDLEIGGEAVVDLKPFLYDEAHPDPDSALVFLYGADARLPIIGGSVFPLSATADVSFQPGDRLGAQLGFTSRFLSFLFLNGYVRYLKNGFIPSYFDANYDLYRSSRYDALQETGATEDLAAWAVKAGTNILDKVVFSAAVEGPFAPAPALASDNNALYPHINASLVTADGLLGGFSVGGSYDKYYLGRSGAFWDDLISPENAQINFNVSYLAGVARITLLYNLCYDPATDTFTTTSSLQASIQY